MLQNPGFLVGGMSANLGACPVCGEECTHVHGWTSHGLHDTYACRGCGVTEYRVAAAAS